MLRSLLRFVSLVTVCSILATPARAQDGAHRPNGSYGSDPSDLPNALKKVESGEFEGVHVDLIARSGAVQAMPSLEREFIRKQDVLEKAKIAQALVKLGDPKPEYWNYLVQITKPILESDAPFVKQYDVKGKEMTGTSPDFIAWAKAHNEDLDSAASNAVYIFPGEILLLGATEDPRSAPLLKRALASKNFLVQVVAAEGLAEIHDESATPVIVDACRNAPTEISRLLAKSLVYFDNTAAQTAVNIYLSPNEAKNLREARSSGKTPMD